MIKFKQLWRVICEAQKADATNLGDLAILKADALGAQATLQAISQLHDVVGYYPPIDLDFLITLPQGSFGYEYARHMHVNNLEPFNVSPELDTLAKQNVFALRYAVTHDIFHVLLGFDTSFAGEMGVLAFAVAQNYSHSQRIGLWIANFLYPLLAPQQTAQIFKNRNEGLVVGHQTNFMLGYRYEEMWQLPLSEVKRKVGLPVD